MYIVLRICMVAFFSGNGSDVYNIHTTCTFKMLTMFSLHVFIYC